MANRELETLKANTERWIDIRSRIATAENTWKQDQVVLSNSVETLGYTLAAVEDSARFYEGESRDLQRKLDDARGRLEAFDRSNRSLLSKIVEYEDRVRELSSSFPPPLSDRVAPLMRRMPAQGDASTDQLPNRLQNVIAIMTLVDEFNKTLTLAHTIRATDERGGVEVRVLYWGLAGGYAASTDGTQAWTIRPSPGEWQWSAAADGDVAAIASLFAVHEKSIDPTFSSVPFALVGKETQP